nr:hypothetical protein [uncultured Devosia sp.]
MTAYGFSAFLKLANSSAKRQRSLIKERLAPSTNGYDFHKAMRSICRGHLVEGVALETSLAAIQAITKDAERNSATNALARLRAWQDLNPGDIFHLSDRTYESPAGVFKVRFSPDFGVELAGRRVGVHLWNTKVPELDTRLTRACLALFGDAYEQQGMDDLAVLSLRKSQLISLNGSTEAADLAIHMIEAIEDIFDDFSDGPIGPSPGVHPQP